jgi:hypothetical protein
MDSLSVNRVFGISEDYTLEQLKKSYFDTMEKLLNSERTQVEKDLLSDQYKKLYYKGKQLYLDKISMESDLEYTNHYQIPNVHSNGLELYDRFDKIFDNNFGLRRNSMSSYNPFSMDDNIFTQLNNQSKLYSNSNSQVYSYSSSYSSKTNLDGSKTIIEYKSESTNGDKKKTTNAYKKMPDGKIVNLSEDEIKQLERMSNLQIEN